MLTPPPPPPQHFLGKKILTRDDLKKKLSTQAKNFEKIIVQVGNDPPAPPPHHFSNGPSLKHISPEVYLHTPSEYNILYTITIQLHDHCFYLQGRINSCHIRSYI